MNTGRRLAVPGGVPWIPTLILLIVLAGPASLARAQDKHVGGHVGFGFPLAVKDGGNVNSLRDFFQIGLPVAITVNGPGRLYFDLELVPILVDKPRDIRFIVNPGFHGGSGMAGPLEAG